MEEVDYPNAMRIEYDESKTVKSTTTTPEQHEMENIIGKYDQVHGQKCETVTLLFIYSKALFEEIIDQYGAVILL